MPSLLAQNERKQKYGLNPRNVAWSNDDSKFGQKLMEKMGWSKGKGLGANEDGNRDFVQSSYKSDTRGLGATPQETDAWVAHQDDFEDLLKALNSENGSNADGAKVEAEIKEQSTGTKRFYGRFARGNVLKMRKAEDLDCIFGKRKSTPQDETQSTSNSSQLTETHDGDVESTHGVTTVIRTQSVQEYFAKKMAERKSGVTNSEDTSNETSSHTKEDDSDAAGVKRAPAQFGNVPFSYDNHEETAAVADKSDKIVECNNTDDDDTERPKVKKKKKKRSKAEEEDAEGDVQCDESSNTPPKKKKKKKHKKKDNDTSDEMEPESVSNVKDDDISLDNSDDLVKKDKKKKKKKKTKCKAENQECEEKVEMIDSNIIEPEPEVEASSMENTSKKKKRKKKNKQKDEDGSEELHDLSKSIAKDDSLLEEVDVEREEKKKKKKKKRKSDDDDEPLQVKSHKKKDKSDICDNNSSLEQKDTKPEKVKKSKRKNKDSEDMPSKKCKLDADSSFEEKDGTHTKKKKKKKNDQELDVPSGDSNHAANISGIKTKQRAKQSVSALSKMDMFNDLAKHWNQTSTTDSSTSKTECYDELEKKLHKAYKESNLRSVLAAVTDDTLDMKFQKAFKGSNIAEISGYPQQEGSKDKIVIENIFRM